MQQISHDIRVNWSTQTAEIKLDDSRIIILSVNNPSPPANMESFCAKIRTEVNKLVRRGEIHTLKEEEDKTPDELKTTREEDLPGNKPNFYEPEVSERAVKSMLNIFNVKMNRTGK